MIPRFCIDAFDGKHRIWRVLVWFGFMICTIAVADGGAGPKVWAKDPKSQYFEAEACYKALREHPQRKLYRENWIRCIRQFQAVQKAEPNGPWAAAGLYKSGQLWEGLYQISRAAKDRDEAWDAYSRVVKRYPQSRYHARARQALKKISPQTISATKPTISRTPPPQKKWRSQKALTRAKGANGAPIKSVNSASKGATTSPQPVKRKAEKHRVQPSSTGGRVVTVTGLRYWSNPSYTRIVIDTDGPTEFHHRLLKKDPAINKPQRLFVDLNHSRLQADVQRRIPINDHLLMDARAAQHSADQVRVVVDIKTVKTHNVFALRNPFRIVIDIRGTQQGRQSTAQATGPGFSTQPPAGSSDIKDLAKQLALGVRRIVVDPGHGGKDYGAPGNLKGVHEKHITLAVARRLARKLRETIGCEVYLTRKDDRYLTLEERTAKANTLGADLFISIHTNASRDRNAHGIETYFLNFATDKEAVLVAARENATSTNNISDLQTILNDLMQNAKINESSKLAAYVQSSTYVHLRKNYSHIKSKGVKQAPFYVLLGAQMPSILVETSFISNPRECKRLTDKKYQDALCEGIVQGISRYVKETAPLALGPGVYPKKTATDSPS